MGRISKFLRLDAVDQRLLMKATILAWTVRLGLWVFPFRVLRQLLVKLTPSSNASRRTERVPVQRIVWAVMVACRCLPAATCLTQALVTKVLLAGYGYPAIVRLGVARSETGELQAHAWVESRGMVVIGGSEASLNRYTPLATATGELW